MNIRRFSISSIISTMLLVPSVLAEDDIITEWLRFLFVDLSYLAESGDQIFVIYFKIFLFFLIFAVLFWSAEKVFSEKGRIAGVVAFIIALISVIWLKEDWILLIFGTYSVIIGYLFLLLPLIIGGVLAHKMAGEAEGHEHIQRIIIGLVFLVISIISFSLSTSLYAEGSSEYFDVAKWARIGGIITLLVGIYYLVTFGKFSKDKKPEGPAIPGAPGP